MVINDNERVGGGEVKISWGKEKKKDEDVEKG